MPYAARAPARTAGAAPCGGERFVAEQPARATKNTPQPASGTARADLVNAETRNLRPSLSRASAHDKSKANHIRNETIAPRTCGQTGGSGWADGYSVDALEAVGDDVRHVAGWIRVLLDGVFAGVGDKNVVLG